MATRWRWPPDSCDGKRVPCSVESPTRSRLSATRRLTSEVVTLPCATSGMAMISLTRRRGLSDENGSWKTGWISLARARRSMSSRRLPSTSTSPALGSIRPNIMRASVVLPQPLSPTTPSTLPAGTEKLTSSTATTRRGAANSPWLARNSRLRPRTSMAGVLMRAPLPAGCKAPHARGQHCGAAAGQRKRLPQSCTGPERRSR